MAAEFFDIAEPVLEIIADRLEKKSTSKHKKAFKKAKKKYLDKED